MPSIINHMNQLAYILGTSHEYQRNDDTCKPESIEEFKQYIKSICLKYDIKAIGEEMSEEALKHWEREISIPKLFAKEHPEISHKYCDPDREEQRKHGIKQSGYYSQGRQFSDKLQPPDVKNLSQKEAEILEWLEDLKREPIWLCEILELNCWPLLFICGSKHVDSFKKLLDNESLNASIISKNWMPKKYNL